MKSERTEDVEISLVDALEGFCAAAKPSSADLISAFRNANATQGYQPFYDLFNRIIFFENDNHIWDEKQNILESGYKYSTSLLCHFLMRPGEAETLNIGRRDTVKEEVLTGLAYQYGIGVKRNIKTAVECYWSVKEKTQGLLENKSSQSDEDKIMRGIALGQLAWFSHLSFSSKETPKNLQEEAIALGNARALMMRGFDKIRAPSENDQADGLVDIQGAIAQGCKQAHYYASMMPCKNDFERIQHRLAAIKAGDFDTLVTFGMVRLRKLDDEMYEAIRADMVNYMPKGMLTTEENIKQSEKTLKTYYNNIEECKKIFAVASERGEWQATLCLHAVHEKAILVAGHRDHLKLMRFYHRAFEQFNSTLILEQVLGVLPPYKEVIHQAKPVLRQRTYGSLPIYKSGEPEDPSIVLSYKEMEVALDKILRHAYEQYTSNFIAFKARFYQSSQAQRNDSFETCYHAAMVLGLSNAEEATVANAQRILRQLARRRPDEFVKLIKTEQNWQARVTLLLGRELGEHILELSQKAYNQPVATRSLSRPKGCWN